MKDARRKPPRARSISTATCTRAPIPAASGGRARHARVAALRAIDAGEQTAARHERRALFHLGRGQRRDAPGPGAGAPHARRLAARRAAPHRHPRRLRARHLRRLLGHARRRAGALVPHVRGAGGRHRGAHRGGTRESRRLALRAAGQLLRGARAAVRLLHAGDADRGAGAARRDTAADGGSRSARRSAATSAGARATSRSSRRSWQLRAPQTACAREQKRQNDRRPTDVTPVLRNQDCPSTIGDRKRRDQGRPALRHGARALRRRHRAPGYEARRDRRVSAPERPDPRRSGRTRRSRAGRALRADRRGVLRRDRVAADRRRCAEGHPLCAGEGRRALCRRMGRSRGRRHARAGRRRRRAGGGRLRAAAARHRSRGSGQAGEPAGAPGARLQRALPPPLRVGAGRGGVRARPSTA